MKSYCTQNNGDCYTCSLVNYNKDCKNYPLFRLLCNEDPVKLGILQKDHNGISMYELAKHIKQCEVCHKAVSWITENIRDAVEENNE